MNRKIAGIRDVVETQLCTGCGACAYAEPDVFAMKDVPNLGRRPLKKPGAKDETGAALAICPGPRLTHTFDENDPSLDRELRAAWGPVYAVWEGYAADPAIRFAGSSGGAASALAISRIERAGAAGVLHTAADESAPYLNKTVYSRSRDDVLAATGSRYSPASPVEGLAAVLREGKSVFIGKPCDVAAVANARRLDAELEQNLDLVIGFFCAGTPSTQGTLDLLKSVGVAEREGLRQLRYRGNGWPGAWTAVQAGPDGEPREAKLSYDQSWGFLQKYRQWRCHICPDHTGEFADVAVGDPWYRPPTGEEPGKSLIVARTKRGVAAVEAAERDGYLVLERRDHSLLARSQPNLLKARGSLWGRLLALKLGAVAPSYRGFPSLSFWMTELSLKEKLQSVLGTLQRIRTKGLNRRLNVGTPERARDSRR